MPAGAATAASKSTVSRAQSDLISLQHRIGVSTSLAFDATVVTQGDNSTAVEVSGTCERPNRYRVTVSQGATPILELSCDGAKIIAYSPKIGSYYTCPAGAHAVPLSDQAYALYVLGVLGQGTANSVLGFLDIFFDEHIFSSPQPIPGETVQISTTESSATLHGAPVTAMVQKASISLPTGEAGAVTGELSYTKSPLSIKSFVAQISQTGMPTVEVVRLSCSRFDIGPAPLGAQEFAYAPPATAPGLTPVEVAATAMIGDALPPGSVAPDFAVYDANGNSVKLSDYTGKVVVIDCWATWCGPCQLALPHTAKIAAKYMSKGVVFMPVCVADTQSNFIDWLPQHKSLGMTFLWDPAGRDAPGFCHNLYHADSEPTQFVVGKDGKIVATLVGYAPDIDPDETALSAAIDKALAVQ
jgi:thiol-disulfide isomerase/thioredoxin